VKQTTIVQCVRIVMNIAIVMDGMVKLMSDRDWSAYAKSSYILGEKEYLRITKSSLTSDFDFCPKQYEYKRIHKLPEPSTDAMTKGTNVHDAIEKFYDNVTPILPELYRLMKNLRNDEALKMALSVIPEQEYHLGEESAIQQRIVWDLERLRVTGVANYLPVINELEVHAFTEEEIEFNGEVHKIPIHFAGSIDRGFATDEGTYALMELKTGKWVQTKDKNDEWQDSKFKVDSMRTEMAFYKKLLAYANHPYQDVTHWGWVYPSGVPNELELLNKYGYEQRGINKIVYESCMNKVGDKHAKAVDKLKTALLTAYLANDFPTKASAGKCAYCNFKSICPSWEGSDNPQEYLDAYQEEE